MPSKLELPDNATLVEALSKFFVKYLKNRALLDLFSIAKKNDSIVTLVEIHFYAKIVKEKKIKTFHFNTISFSGVKNSLKILISTVAATTT